MLCDHTAGFSARISGPLSSLKAKKSNRCVSSQDLKIPREVK